MLEVTFVTNKGDNNLGITKLLCFLQPLPCVDERFTLGDIVHEQRPNSSSVLARAQGQTKAHILGNWTYNAVIA